MKMKLSNTYRFKSAPSAVWGDLMGYKDIERYRQEGAPFQPLEVEQPDESHYIVRYEKNLQIKVTILENIPEEKLRTRSVVVNAKGQEANQLEAEYILSPSLDGGTELTFNRSNEMPFSAWLFTKVFRKKEDLFQQQMKQRLGEA